MRRVFYSLIFLTICCQAAAAGEVSYPYTAQVTNAEVEVRSGPGDEYYPTEKLGNGMEVEVYQETPEGWLAIRPTGESFSFIFSRHVEQGVDGIGRVNKDSVPSRIGSLLTDERNVIQIRLQQDELVEILGEEEAEGHVWYKIAPPSGEFRWVKASDIEKQSPVEPPAIVEEENTPVEPQAEAVQDSWIEPAAHEVPSRYGGVQPVPKPQNEAPPLLSNSSPAGQIPQPTTQPQPPPTQANPSDWVPKGTTPAVSANTFDNGRIPWRRTSQRHEEQAANQVAPTTQPQSTAAAVPSSERTMSARFTEQIVDLDSRLSAAVTAPRGQWNLANLEREAEALLATSQTVGEREAAKYTISKIDRFTSIQRRFERFSQPGQLAQAPIAQGPAAPSTTGPIQPLDTLPAGAQPVGPPVGPLTAVAVSPLGNAASQPAQTRRSPDRRNYDAIGELRTVNSPSPAAPKFALVNGAGQIVSLVTPTPDLDLRPYIGLQVGVVGNRNFLPGFRQAHVTAGRVTPIRR